MSKVPEHVHAVEVSSVGLEGLTVEIIAASHGWAAAPHNSPLRLGNGVFVGELRLDPGDMALVKVEGIHPAQWPAIEEARGRAGAMTQGDTYNQEIGVAFLMVPGWKSSSARMDFQYSVVPDVEDGAA